MSRLPTQEEMHKALEERVKILGELWEKDHHTIELLSIYIPKLTDILIKYWGVSGEHREAVLGDLRGIRDAVDEHFKTHYLDKKKREEYASKRKTLRYKQYTNE